MNDNTTRMSRLGQPSVSRRSVARTAAWAAPAISVATAAPAFASTPQTCPVNLVAASQVHLTDSGQTMFVSQVNIADNDWGVRMEAQQWAQMLNGQMTPHWRLAFGSREVLEDVTLTITLSGGHSVDPNQVTVYAGAFYRAHTGAHGGYGSVAQPWVLSSGASTTTLVYTLSQFPLVGTPNAAGAANMFGGPPDPNANPTRQPLTTTPDPGAEGPFTISMHLQATSTCPPV